MTNEDGIIKEKAACHVPAFKTVDKDDALQDKGWRYSSGGSVYLLGQLNAHPISARCCTCKVVLLDQYPVCDTRGCVLESPVAVAVGLWD